MILSDKTLRRLLEKRELIVDPIGKDSIQPASIDCRLGNHFLAVEHNRMEVLTLTSKVQYREIKGEVITLPPHSFILTTTIEYIKLPNNLTAFVEGRSSVGRLGLFIQNAGWVDPGFAGNLTLELYNANSLPIKLESGRRICQLVFCSMDQHSQSPYQGKYLGQRQTVGSRAYLDKT